MRSGDQPEWRFHVTTLVKGPNGRWLAFDPIIGKVTTAEGWMDIVQKTWDKNKKAIFYLVDGKAVLPNITEFVGDLSRETGHNINDLSFDPTKHQGFSRYNGFSIDLPVYTLDRANLLDRFFTELKDDRESPFNPIEVNAGGEIISYNNFFLDLFDSLNQEAPLEVAGARAMSLATEEKSAGQMGKVNKPSLGLNVERLRQLRGE